MQYNNIMQDLESYDMEGLLSEDVRETVCDIVCSIEPPINSIDWIDIDTIIQAVENGAFELEDVFDVHFDNDADDWFIVRTIRGKRVRSYFGIGSVHAHIAFSYAAFFCNKDVQTRVMYRIGETNWYKDLGSALEAASEIMKNSPVVYKTLVISRDGIPVLGWNVYSQNALTYDIEMYV